MKPLPAALLADDRPAQHSALSVPGSLHISIKAYIHELSRKLFLSFSLHRNDAL